MKRFQTLRSRLMVSFLAASLAPLVVAAAVTIPWFRGAITSEAQRTLETHSAVATGLYSDRLDNAVTNMTSAASAFSDAEQRQQDRIAPELAKQAELVGLDYMLWVDLDNVVRGATTGQQGHKLDWPDLERAIEGGKAMSFTAIVPVTELVHLDLDDELHMTVKETKGGSAPNSEAAGALSLVAIAPVTDENNRQVGFLVGVDTLKYDNRFVDSVVEKVGGVSTIFQNGVRIATTVQDDQGARAVATAVSDPVRQAVLDAKEPYRGEAFVVNKQYLTAYDPILDMDGNPIGMMFVGIEQAPYTQSALNFSLAMAALGLVGLAIAIVFAYVGSAQLALPLRRVNNAAELIAGGDLTVHVGDERSSYTEAKTMAGAFNVMTSGLRQFIGNVARTAQRLDVVASGIAEASAEEAQAASAQASAVAEATSTIEELDRSFAAVAEGARRVLTIAEDSLEVADQGRGAVEGGAATLERLAMGSNSVREAAGSLADVAEDIGQVTFVIGSIAEQTKILALNAAIEAARAGTAGKGFAVVAKEIRTLADSVTSSVDRIEELVRGIQDASRNLAQTAQQQADLSLEGVQGGASTRDAFDSIYDRMDRTAAAAREIATAAAQQQSAAKQIVGVMHQVSQAVSSTAASAHQLAESSREVKQEASSLSEGLNGYRLD